MMKGDGGERLSSIWGGERATMGPAGSSYCTTVRSVNIGEMVLIAVDPCREAYEPKRFNEHNRSSLDDRRKHEDA